MTKLTPKQELFAQTYIKTGNASEAYRTAYDVKTKNINTINVKASELMNNPNISHKIKELREKKEKYWLESSSVPLDDSIYNGIVNHFGDIEKAKKWASSVISKEALELGAEVQKIGRETINKTTRYYILNRANFKCQACGAKPKPDNDVELHIDHIKPYSLGGTNEEDNLQVLCRDCNISKGNRFGVNHNE